MRFSTSRSQDRGWSDFHKLNINAVRLMQSRAFHTKQMAGTGVAAAFNWDTSVASSSATWGGSSYGTPSSISGFSATGGPLISDTGMHKKVCSSVKEVAANVDKNQQFRPYMEDGRSLLTQNTTSKMASLAINKSESLLFSMDTVASRPASTAASACLKNLPKS